MKILKAAMIAGLALLGSNSVSGKKHYKVDGTVSKDHPIVKATAIQNE